MELFRKLKFIHDRLVAGKYFLSVLLRRYRKKKANKNLPLKGYTNTSFPTINYIDGLNDSDLIELNELLDWNSFTTDAHGRRFGMAAWASKRTTPEQIPNARIELLNTRFGLADKHVLEVGCFEGAHTIGLFQYTEQVTAIDARIDHVVKTIVRCAMYGYYPRVFKYDIEDVPADVSLLGADVIHHVGVLYHLFDPVSHLIDLGRYIKLGVMLDTHYALPDEANEDYFIDGKRYSYKRYVEYGKKEAFSGMNDHSKWLLLDDIISCLKMTGFSHVEIIEERHERNGPRALILAQRV